jgi:hypothetical protein
MNVFNRICIVGLAVWFCGASFDIIMAQARDQEGSSAVNVQLRIADKLTQFETNRSVELLRAALVDLQSAHDIDRKQRARLWLEMFSAIDLRLDPSYGTPHYSATNRYSINLVPPPDGVGGPVYPSGVDPSVFKNAEARVKYEEMLKANKGRAANHTFQKALHALNREAMREFGEFFGASFGSSESDKAELAEMVKKSSLSEHRKRQITSLIGAH